ncbi:MAG TPA: VCBS repeat-containing protein [Polyangia bacterium]|nr:VCBS repeat-containing protein [Polyangia bacterium]
MAGVLVLLLAAASPDGGASGGRAVALEATAETTANVSLGDLDGDGDLDIVLAKGRHWPLTDLVLLNDGKGGFAQRHPVSARADRSYAAALADLDGDGDLDLVVGNDAPDEKLIYTNDGRGHFSLAGTFGSRDWPTRNVTVADLDGDRRPDLVIANRSADPRGATAPAGNQVCLNDGRGRFPACRLLSPESATTIAAGDMDGDGAIDLVVPHRDGGQSYVLYNDGRGNFRRRLPFGPPDAATRAVALGDLDGDGRLDIVVGHGPGGAAVHFNGKGGFAPARRIGEGVGTPYALATADLDGDGEIDVVVGNERGPGALLFNRGRGRRFEVFSLGDGKGSVYGVAVGDVDRDGHPDVVAARSDAPSMLYPGFAPTCRKLPRDVPLVKLDVKPGSSIVDLISMYASLSCKRLVLDDNLANKRIDLPPGPPRSLDQLEALVKEEARKAAIHYREDARTIEARAR